LRFLSQHMADPASGGWFWRCSRDGSLLEDVKHTYGHAFVIFGLAEYARATGESSAAQTAGETLQVLLQRAAGPAGGLWTLMARDWQPLERRRSQNPHMHLLEACLSLHAATGESAALDTALDLAHLAAERFVYPEFGCLEEYFAEDWARLPEGDAAAIEVGHQFEWCWLLHRLADRSGQEHWRDLADRLAEWALRYGLDSANGGFYDECSRRGEPVRTTKTFWVQAEALRALLYLIAARERADLRDVFVRSVRFVMTHCVDREFGGWFATVDAAGRPIRPEKGSEWKLDYHMVSLCDEAIRLLSYPRARPSIGCRAGP